MSEKDELMVTAKLAVVNMVLELQARVKELFRELQHERCVTTRLGEALSGWESIKLTFESRIKELEAELAMAENVNGCEAFNEESDTCRKCGVGEQACDNNERSEG